MKNMFDSSWIMIKIIYAIDVFVAIALIVISLTIASIVAKQIFNGHGLKSIAERIWYGTSTNNISYQNTNVTNK